MAVKIGVVLVLANLLAWAVVFVVAPVAPPRELTPTPVPPPTRPGEIHIFNCWDCPHLGLLDREFGSYWDPLPVKLLALANFPSLRLASGPRDYFDTREIKPGLFVVGMVLQWFVVGALAAVLHQVVLRSRGARSRRSVDTKPSVSSR